MIQKLSLFLLALLIVAVTGLRFWQLDKIPYGYHVDEYSGSVAVKCLATEGVDAHLIPHPLFFNLNYGTPKPPVYAYPAALWMKTFGYTADHLRSFTACVYTIGLIGLFFLARLFFGNAYALLTVLIAAISPWSFGLSRIGYESTFTIAFTCWGIYFFLRSNRILDKICASFLLCAACYAYPPSRVQIPLLLPLLLLLDYKRQGISKKALCAFIISFILPCIPLVQKTLNGEIQGRFNNISITSPEYLKSISKTNVPKDIIAVFLNNYATHFSKEFLITKGDPSYVHSTRHNGIFSWLDLLGFLSLLLFISLCCLKKKPDVLKDKWFLLFCVLNFFIAIVPAGLTNSELPNSLRIIWGLPFTALLAAYGLWKIIKQWQAFWLCVLVCAAAFSFTFFKMYFTVYPVESKGMFNFWTKEEAEAIKTDIDWLRFMVHYVHDDYHFRYYLMNLKGDSCTESRQKWQAVWKWMDEKGILY